VIGFAIANFAPERLLSLIVGAAHLFEDNLESFQNIDGKDPDAFLKVLEAFLGEKIACRKAEYSVNIRACYFPLVWLYKILLRFNAKMGGLIVCFQNKYTIK